MHTRWIFLLCLDAFIPSFSFSQNDTTPGQKFADKISVSGYVKSMETISVLPNTNSSYTDQLFHHRLNIRVYPAKRSTGGFDLRTRIFFGHMVSNAPGYSRGIEKSARGYFDWSALWLDQKSVAGHSTVDRAWLEWSNHKWEARIGRQRINWGMNLGWNPNDIFNSYSLFDFDYEERPGVDGLLVKRNFGGTNHVAVGITPGRTTKTWTAGALFRFNKWKYDWQIMGACFHEDLAIGGGWAGNLGRAGFKGEMTYFHPAANLTDTTGALSLAANLDYVFPKGLYLNGGFLYNSIGARGNALITAVGTGFFQVPSPKSLMPSRITTMAMAMYPLTPALNSGLTILFIPAINLIYLMPNFGYSIAANWDLDLIAQVFFGDLGKGFTALGSAGFLRLRWSY